MKRFLGAVLMVLFVLNPLGSVRAADDEKARAILDKAIKAVGGAEKLGAIKGFTWKTKGKISVGDNFIEFTAITTVQDLEHSRSEIESDFMGNKMKSVTILAGDKGWRKFGEMVVELNKDELASGKRGAYLQTVPATLVQLKDKGIKIESAGVEMIGARPAAALKITGPDGKDFQLSFDQESGLPVKLVAKVTQPMMEEFLMETTFSEYKDFNGIKKATKLESKRDGKKFIDLEISDFRLIEKVDPKIFAEPE
jgi:hypothetical protein